MYLKSLEISGFKSFAKKVDLRFNASISAIVGPNGSGKSNVAEAFRFVLGEQSIKSMRGKRGEDLIFNGTSSSSQLNRASAKIVFDNSKKFLDIDYEEVSIERIVYRDGANQYFINKNLVRLKDITELLAGANIGSSGYHIISQGEADRILNVNSQERRAIIEEALGLKIYQYKRIVSERKLQKVAENIEKVQSLRRENAPHLKFLKKQVEKIQESLEMREELRKLYQEYFKRENFYLKYWNDKLEKDKNPLIAELSKLEDRLNQTRSLLFKKHDEPSEKNHNLIIFEKRLNELRKEKDTLNLKLGRVEGTISALKIVQPKLGEKTTKDFSWDEIKNLEEKLVSQVELAESLEDANQIKTILKRVKQLFSQFIADHLKSEVLGNQPEGRQSIKLKELKIEQEKIEKELNILNLEEKQVLFQYHSLKLEIEKERDSNRDAELAVFEIASQQNEIRTKLNFLKNQEEKIIIDGEEYRKELREAYILAGKESTQFQSIGLKNEKGEILNQFDCIKEERNIQIERRKKLERIKIKIEDLGGGAGEEILKEYKETQQRDEFLTCEISDLEKSAEGLTLLINELKEKINIEFKEGLLKIDNQFRDFFVLMFGGGKASLKLVKEQKIKKNRENELNLSEEDLIAEIEEPADKEEGIEVNVALPNKKIKGLQMLSGGDRSLTSIALLFAMSQVNPPPFIILDETDAALDEANSKKYGDMIENLSRSSQLILITHNRETMSRANILYGVTMGNDGISKLLSVHFDEAVKVAK